MKPPIKFALSLALACAACLFQPVHAATVVQDIPFTDDFDTCTNETISMTGVQRIVERTTVDINGRMHHGFHRTTYAVGFSQRDGAKFTLRDEVNRNNIEFSPGQPKLLVEGYVSTLIRAGNNMPDDDARIYMHGKTLWNEEGKILSSVVIDHAICR